ncbi:Hypothetical protein NTJ_05725 [Nesidiocoris tenuis]|uniref:Uncharacterized protein n=1 Tax=Nesidiocoris tenuis TaxID=355587 RepID=A0ABN7AL12_9HEMI|nr:Hypothetical protein NTJ_05725 [Nesidiocoris tenuis]
MAGTTSISKSGNGTCIIRTTMVSPRGPPPPSLEVLDSEREGQLPPAQLSWLKSHQHHLDSKPLKSPCNRTPRRLSLNAYPTHLIE